MMFQIFNTTDGRPVTICRGTDRDALAYATALGGAYDYEIAEPGFYIERKGSRTDILTARYSTRFEAQHRADMENMASDAYSFSVIEAT